MGNGRGMTRDDLEHFFEQKHLSKIGVENPAFCKVLPSEPSADSGTDRQDTRLTNSTVQQGWQTAQFNRCLWRWQEDERARQSGHPESSQGPSDFCTVYSQMLYQLSYSRSGMWPQATTILLVIICCTSQGAGWFRAFFWQEQLQQDWCTKTA